MNKLQKSELEKMVEKLEKELSLLLKSEPALEEEKEEQEKEKVEEAKEAIEREAAHEAEMKEKEEKEKEQEQAKEEQREEEHEDSPYTPEEIEELRKLYESMSEEERKIHRDILEKCGEVKVVKKSENHLLPELKALRKENALLKKSLEELTGKFLNYIQGKAATRKTIDVLQKGEPLVDGQQKTLSKSEIFEQLKQRVKDPTLSKSDRDAINRYLLEGQKDINLIKHLLKV